jgi:hypothetical protein
MYVAWSEELAVRKREVVLAAGRRPDEFLGVDFIESPEGMVGEAQERPTLASVEASDERDRPGEDN